MPGRVVLFAHFDGEGGLRPWVRHHLAALRELADELHLVSTSPLDGRARDLTGPLCDSVLEVENRGYDFMMWRRALERRGWEGIDELVLTNSSVVGPLRPLRRLFESMAGEPLDFWGITESIELRWHLQSYFLVLRRPVVESGVLQPFFASVLPWTDKDQLIKSYEVGLTAWLLQHGFRGRAVAAGLRDDPRCRIPRADPTTADPALALALGSPYVKVSLFRSNPYHADLRALENALVRAGLPREALPPRSAPSVHLHPRTELARVWRNFRRWAGVPLDYTGRFEPSRGARRGA